MPDTMKTVPFLSVGLLCVGLLCSEAAAQARNPFFDAALRLYDALEFEAALEQLDKAASFAGNQPADETRIAVYRGIVKLELGDATRAKTDFMTALAFDSELRLPDGVSPRIRDFFAKTRKEFLAANPAAAAPPMLPALSAKKRGPQNPPSQPLLPVPQAKQPAAVAVAAPPAPAAPAALVASRPAPGVPLQALEPDPPAVSEPASGGSGLRVLSYALFGVGAALGGGGGYLGMQSSQSVRDARGSQTQVDAGARLESARTQALGANVLFGAATASVVGGLIALVTSD